MKKRMLASHFCASIGRDGRCYCSDQIHYSGLFYRDELVAMKDAIEKTLNDYEELEISDDYVDEKDNLALEKYMSENRASLLSRKKIQKDDDLYLILDKEANLLKIGRSTNVESRLKQLQSANGHVLELLCIIKNKGNLESTLHDKFSELKTSGEWYKYSDDIINEYSSLGGVFLNKTINKDKEEEKELKEKFAEFVKLYKKLTKKNTRGVDTEFAEFSKRHKNWKEIVPYLSIAIERETKAREQARLSHKFFPEPKMLQTYLGKQKAWELYVTVGDDINAINNEYTPQAYNIALVNGEYLMTGMYFDGDPVLDGYEDDKRPNGATIKLHNSQGYIIWNATSKTWTRYR